MGFYMVFTIKYRLGLSGEKQIPSSNAMIVARAELLFRTRVLGKLFDHLKITAEKSETWLVGFNHLETYESKWEG